MFTGIVETVGEVLEIRRGAQSSRLRIAAPDILGDVHEGDSICTNGVCLTVDAYDAGAFQADVMAESLRYSSLGDLKVGSPVNLERAMRADGRFGGHFVSGHIDGTGSLRRMDREDNAIWLEVECPRELMPYIVRKGSVSLDGTSLTVAEVLKDGFRVSLIPHTGEKTILTGRRTGQRLNIEVDMLGKIVEKLLFHGDESKREAGGISHGFLAENGFI